MTNPYRLTLTVEGNGEESNFRLVRLENADEVRAMIGAIQVQVDELKNLLNLLFVEPE